MIPVLYEADEKDFTHFGIGALVDTTSCLVTEERNGAYELVLNYPIGANLHKELRSERLIKAKVSGDGNNQLFRIYRVKTPINGLVTVYAQHISYDLLGYEVLPFETDQISPALLLEKLLRNTGGFEGFTDYSEARGYEVRRPKNVRSCLGGSEGSMLSSWRGEFKWDNYRVHLLTKRGRDTGLVISYARNLTSFDHDEDITGVFSSILPFAVYQDEEGVERVLLLPEETLAIQNHSLKRDKVLIKDFTDQFSEGEKFSEDLLRARADSYLRQNPLGIPMPKITLSFTEGMLEEYALLEDLSLCDKVKVHHKDLGVLVESKIIKTVYDTLAERFVSLTLGDPGSNLLSSLNETQRQVKKAEEKIGRFPQLLKASIERATGTLAGQKGGYIVIVTDPITGQPRELLILDTPDVETSQKVWRFNQGGLGYSKSGVKGPYELAITSQGEIVADFITSGTLTANIIRSGVLASLDGSSYWDLNSGEVVLKAYATTSELEAVNLDISGLKTGIEVVTNRSSELQSSIDGLTSYVSNVTEKVKETQDGLDASTAEVQTLSSELSSLKQSVDRFVIGMTNRSSGGINFIRNSAGLNGLTDDWQRTGVVEVINSTEVQNNTISDSAFRLLENSELSQTVTGLVTGKPYVLSLRAKKVGSNYTSAVSVTYNGNKKVHALETKTAFDWQEYAVLIPGVEASTLTVTLYNRAGSLLISDLILSLGDQVQNWSPAHNEIYTHEVKIDRHGISVRNSESSQKTVITNNEFSGYYLNERIFTLNKDETLTKKTTVDGELTVGKTKFIPKTRGLDIVILD